MKNKLFIYFCISLVIILLLSGVVFGVKERTRFGKKTSEVITIESVDGNIHTFYFKRGLLRGYTVTPIEKKGPFGGAEELENDLVSYYKMDEKNGFVFDSNLNYDSINYGSDRGVSGKIGNCYSFDGVDDYVDSDIPLIFEDYTVSMWVYLEKNEGVQALFGQTITSNGHFRAQLENRDGKFRAYTNYEGGPASAWEDEVRNIGEWYHVVMVGDEASSSVKLYVNNELVSESIKSGNYFPGRIQESTRMGANGILAWRSHLYGKLDEVGVWSRALTSDDISTLYNSGDGLSY